MPYPVQRPNNAVWLNIFAMLTLLTVTDAFAALDSQRVFERHENAVFQIRVIHKETGKKRSIGSGFIFDRSNRLATNYHVVSDFIDRPETYYLSYLSADGNEGRLRLLAVDAVHDLALVESDVALGDPLNIGEPPAKGAALFAMGNPLDLGLTIAAGTNGGVLNQTDDSRILFSGSLNPGMSGGPTFDDAGTVVGINVATARNDISFIVPSRYLEPLLATETQPKSFLDDVAHQIRKYQINYLDRIKSADWPSNKMRNMQIPAAISPTIRCWDASPKPRPQHLYQRFTISCKNENDIFLTQQLDVGKILYEFIWIESDELDPLRFYRLYQALNASQFGSRATEDDVTHFRCTTRFVDVNGMDFKTTLCARSYKRYSNLSDVLFTAAMVGRKDTGFIFNLDLSGSDFNAATHLIARFLKEIRWQP